MKGTLLICFISTLLINAAQAQTARLNISISNLKLPANVFIEDRTVSYADLKNSNTPIDLDSKGRGAVTIDVPQAKYVMLNVYPSNSYNGLDYRLFLSPGDNMDIKIDFKAEKSRVTISGAGSANNRPDFNGFTDVWPDNKHVRDKTPYTALNIFKKELTENNKIFGRYVMSSQYKDNGLSQGRPSDVFMKVTRYNLDYYLAIKYFELKSATLDDTHFSGPWQNVQDSLFRTIKLNNDDALPAYNYQALLATFMEREWERLLRQQEKDPAAFYKQWYHTTDAKEGERLFNEERKNLLREKIINRYFSGKTAEHLYVELLKGNMRESNYKNIDVIFDHFKKKYPANPAVKWFRGPIADIAQKRKRTLTNKMVLLPGNGSKLNTVKEVAALFKGKTVFVDMWGTWCSPCREDIEKNTGALHAALKGKNVQFLYIANFDLKHAEEWKKLIAYYGLEGNHILANEALSKDIMAKTKSNGFPTYSIIRKDGTVVKAKSQYPLDSDVAVKELLDDAK